jgi:antitoxin component YwqK of YwqJK toxin-antitoxin module
MATIGDGSMDRRIERIEYPDNGWAEIQYAGDERDGLWTVYRADGSKDWERQYVAGRQSGYERTWDEVGYLIEEKWFLDGLLHGSWRTWDSSGVLRRHYQFVKGQQEGLQSCWDETGNLIAQGTITAGLREGTFVADVLNASETATKRMVLEYRQGRLLTDLHWG